VEVLYAVALNETGRKDAGRLRPWPWAINREGKGYWFESRDEALSFARQSLAAGRTSFDVGCVQINYRWHGHAFPSIEDMFDPEWTATYAAQFLRTLYEERGDWTAAAGAYHSLTPELARKYGARFQTMLATARGQTEVEALVAAAPERLSTRGARREAQRRAMAERMRLAGPPPPAVNGGIAAAMLAPAGGALLTQGGPLLTPGQPLFAAPGGSLF
jgi:soluble lytic murein transglycosylase-like protein